MEALREKARKALRAHHPYHSKFCITSHPKIRQLENAVAVRTSLQTLLVLFPQGKTAWVDQSRADLPGFPVLGVGDAPPPEVHPGASECAPGLAFAFMALDTQQMFLQHKGGTHIDFPANFDAGGNIFQIFWQRECDPSHGLGSFRQGKCLLKNRSCLQEHFWNFSSETAIAFLSFAEHMGR